MKRFLLYLLYFSLPFIFLLVLYAIVDPFKVVRNHDDYSTDLIPLNREAVGLALFRKNTAEYRYNAFIMGNSRSIFYHADHWKEHLGPDAVPFHFDASAEDIYGVWQKLRYVDQNAGRIKHLLWITDHESYAVDPSRSGHLFIRHPDLGAGVSWLGYEAEFFKTFLHPIFLASWADFRLTGNEKSYMRQYLEFRSFRLIAQSNELRMDTLDRQLARSPDEYYNRQRMAVFYSRDSIETYSEPVIKAEQKDVLRKIKAILDKHKTDYRIVINPLYDQQKFNPDDLKVLQAVFGSRRVYDFSGINPITADYRNYYESSHYRPHVADRIMDSIYANGAPQ